MYGQAQSDEAAALPEPKLLEDPIEWSKGYVGQTNIPRWVAWPVVLGFAYYVLAPEVKRQMRNARRARRKTIDAKRLAYSPTKRRFKPKKKR